jgi:hypothetical protein
LFFYSLQNSVVGLIAVLMYWGYTEESGPQDVTPGVIIFCEFLFLFINFLFYLIILVAEARPPLYLIIIVFTLPSLLLLLVASSFSEAAMRLTLNTCLVVNIILSVVAAIQYRWALIKRGVE